MKVINSIYILLFVALLAAPVALSPWFSDTENTEKRELAAFPDIYTEEEGLNSDFASEFDDYLRDHSAFRNTLVNTESYVLATYMGQSAVDSVILGKDGWLYYKEELNDYLNKATITERTAGNIAKTYKMVEEALKESGTAFVFSIAPNKSSIYDHMPYYYTQLAADGNMELLLKAFEEAGVTHTDLANAFKQESTVLYQRTDSHWTYEGALFAYREIIKASGLELDMFEDMTFEERRDWSGDLAVMLYSNPAPDYQKYSTEPFDFSYTSRETAVDALSLSTKNPKGTKNLLNFRDSFSNTMHVFFAEAFASAEFERAVPYDLTNALNGKYDLVTVELVERNIANLAGKAPMMQAPTVELSLVAETVNPLIITLKTVENGRFTHFFGEVDETVLGTDYELYIMLYDDESSQAYAAFPIFEQELMEAENPQDNGFSAYIAKTLVQDKKVAVLLSVGDKMYFADMSESLEPEQFTTGLIEKDGELYYVDLLNGITPGRLEYEGKKYYINADGSLYSGWIEDDHGKYYYDPATKELLTGEAVIDGKTYYFFEDGLAATGWLKFDRGYRYYGEDGAVCSGVITLSDGTYYLDKDGYRLSGLFEQNGEVYYYDDDGKLYTGWLEFNGRRYFDADGKGVNGWQFIDDHTYYFADYLMTEGWLELDGAKYYFANGIMTTGFTTIDSKTYCFDSEGKMYVGTHVIDGIEYTFAEDGSCLSGWKDENGKRYYLAGGKKVTGFMNIDGNTYYFGSDGAMVTGFWTISGVKYYFYESGAMAIGFNTIGGSKYYFASSGKMLTGWQTINSKLYYFYSSGKMAVSTAIGEYTIDANGVATFRFSTITRSNLSDYIEYLLDKNGRSLEAVFRYCGRKNFSYFYRTPASDVEGMAIDMFNTGKGSCHEFSAITYLMVKALGYNCMIVTGKGAYYDVHKWVLIEVEPGVWRHMDTERSQIVVYLLTDAELDAFNGISENIRYEWDKSLYPAAE